MELTLRDLVEKSSIDLSRVRLIRHALNHDKCKECNDLGHFDLYNSHQSVDFSDIGDYWIVFKSGLGTTAILYNVYKVIGKSPDTQYNFPDNFPDGPKDECAVYSLEVIDEFNEYTERLVIDWGKDTVNWYKFKLDLKIIAIKDTIKEFDGYEYFTLSFDELTQITSAPHLYNNWYAALSKINAIYLIVDRVGGKQYIGSSYGEKGLWGRWAEYAKNKHGNNEGLKELLKEHPDRYNNFSFTILQVLPLNIKENAIDIETKWKKKLNTYYPLGYNKN